PPQRCLVTKIESTEPHIPPSVNPVIDHQSRIFASSIISLVIIMPCNTQRPSVTAVQTYRPRARARKFEAMMKKENSSATKQKRNLPKRDCGVGHHGFSLSWG